MTDDKTLWNNRSQQWPAGAGPDPRLAFSFWVTSRDAHTAPDDRLIPEGEWGGNAKTLEAAYTLYRKRIMRATTVECDLRMKLEIGGYYHTFDGPACPRFNTSYVYVARWRKDGAFIESYHVNDSKFAERGEERNELDQNHSHPGLLSHWVAQEAERKRQKNSGE